MPNAVVVKMCQLRQLLESRQYAVDAYENAELRARIEMAKKLLALMEWRSQTTPIVS